VKTKYKFEQVDTAKYILTTKSKYIKNIRCRSLKMSTKNNFEKADDEIFYC